MALRVQEWFTDLLGLQQSVSQFGAQQVPLQNYEGPPIECSAFLAPNPIGFESVSLAVIKDNLAVIPSDWRGGGIKQPWYSIESHDTFTTCTNKLSDSSFISFHEDFVDYIGPKAKLEKIHTFTGDDAQHVHEAPAYIEETNELVFADTAVIGWLWALEVDTHKIRKITTTPPLPNVNGATIHKSNLYLTTNGGHSPGIYNCTLPSSHSSSIDCTCIVNNYHLTHLNSPNDLIFTPTGSHILFTDPTYGWLQSWPGINPPELPTSTYHFNTHTRALTPLDNDQVLQPNGLALSADEKTLFIAESNSTSSKPVQTWEDSVRNIYAFEFDEAKLTMRNRRLVHVVAKGWPDGIRVTKWNDRELLLVATMGGVDVVDVSRGGAGVMLGKWNVGEDMVFNLERVVRGAQDAKEAHVAAADTWVLTGKKGVYRVQIGR